MKQATAIAIAGLLLSGCAADPQEHLSRGKTYLAQKKYEEALKYLEKAAQDEDEGHHIEIWDHWADALVALDKKKEAIGVWQKALKFEDVSPRDNERRKKVTQKLNKVKDELEKK